MCIVIERVSDHTRHVHCCARVCKIPRLKASPTIHNYVTARVKSTLSLCIIDRMRILRLFAPFLCDSFTLLRPRNNVDLSVCTASRVDASPTKIPHGEPQQGTISPLFLVSETFTREAFEQYLQGNGSKHKVLFSTGKAAELNIGLRTQRRCRKEIRVCFLDSGAGLKADEHGGRRAGGCG